MSAKWRRSKRNMKRFDVFRAFSKARNKKAPQVPWVKKSRNRKQIYSCGGRIPKIHIEGKIEEPDPLIDVLEEKDEIVIVAELVGFSRENLKIHVKDQRLILSAETSNRRYHKSLNLPKRVIPDALSTTYKNGVLEMRLKKAMDERVIDKVAG